MTKYATMNPPGSTSPYDLFDNSQNFDTAINSITAAIWQDRLGKSRHTWYGIESLALISMLNYGYITKKSFEQGATLDTPNTVLQLESNGEHYRWDGDWSQPKVVPPGSTPESAGGVGPGKWVGVGDASLRGQLSDQDGVEKYPEIQMSRWRDEGDIRGWGAIGDADEAGTSGRDDTAAIQAALNSGKKKLKIPANHHFLVTQTLVVPSGISLVGEDQFSSCIVAAPSMDGILDVMHNAGYNAPTVKYDRNIVFSNFRIHANGFSRVKSDPDVEWGRCLRTGALKGLSINKMVFQEGPQHCLDIACWKDAYIGVGHAGAIPGMTTDARVTDSYLIDYCYDDGLTTHGADGVTVSNCTAMITDYAKSRHVQVITQNGFEIDDGSSNVVVSNCRTYGNDTNSKGFAIANHDGNPIPFNIRFENCDAYGTVTGVATLGVADASHAFGSQAYRGRNYAIINCSLNHPHVATDNAEFPSRGVDIQFGMDVVVENFRVNMRGQNGEPARSPCAVFNIIGVNIRIDGVRVEGVPDGQMGTIFGTGRSWFRITNAASSGIRIRNVDIDNIGWADRVIRDVDKNPGGALIEVDNIKLGSGSTDGRTKTVVMSAAVASFKNITAPAGVQTLRIGRTLSDRTALFTGHVDVNYAALATLIGGLRIVSETAPDGTQPLPGLLFDRQYVSSSNTNGKGSVAFRSSAAAPGTWSLTAFDEDSGLYQPVLAVSYNPGYSIKKYISPVGDGDTNNGNSTARWLNVYSVNGVITTSNATHKTGLREPTEAENMAFGRIARLPDVWKWIKRVEEEGDEARWHSGPTVQAAIAIMEDYGLEWREYSCFCYDHQPYVPERRVTIPALIDEGTGDVLFPEHEQLIPAIKESEEYGFRKEELLWRCMRALTNQIDQLEARVTRLEGQ
ncbi:tail fiber domain-containing protein [Escherichia coli]|uniref:tail fiber/spike domain-containing protein n=1 Tax=Escherichia coli TaxID=562 RepID=UPI002024278A|nr:hypothetical protein [Escherichia coli]